MSNHVLQQEDFFLYVPSTKDVKGPCAFPYVKETDLDKNVPCSSATHKWVKIPLEGRMTVYARVWNAGAASQSG